MILLIFFISYTFSLEHITNLENKRVDILKINLDKYKIITPLSNSGETLEELVKKVGGIAGINGAYFCPADYKHCGYNHTYAPRVFEGKLYSLYGEDFGANGMFGFDKNGNVIFILNRLWGNGGISRKYNSEMIKELYYGIGNFPVLVLEGQNVLNESSDLIDNKMKTKGLKNFICVLSDLKTVYMGIVHNVTIYELADFAINLGCYYAINLDSGGSLGLYYNGKYIKKPSRNIMDAFVVIKKNVYELTDKEIAMKFSKKLNEMIQEGKIDKITVIEVLKKYKNKTKKIKNKLIIEEILKNL